MFPASTKGGGMVLAFPDVCKTPALTGVPIPIPYPNISQTSSKEDTAPSKVKIRNKSVTTKPSSMRRSTGDQPGTLKGMVSSKNIAKTQFKTQGKIKLNAEHQKIVNMLSSTSRNGGPSPEQFQEALIAYCVQVSALYKVEHPD